MFVLPEGSTTKMPAHSAEVMPCTAAMADILSDPDVCWVSLLSSAGCTTLIVDCASGFVDCALGRDNLGIANSPLNREQIGQLSRARANHRYVFHALSVRSQLTLANILYCTVQYIMKALGSNPSSRQNSEGSRAR